LDLNNGPYLSMDMGIRAKLEPVGAAGFSPRSADYLGEWALALASSIYKKEAQG